MEIVFFWAIALVLIAIFVGWLFYQGAASAKWGYAVLGFVSYSIISIIAYYIPARILMAMGITGWGFAAVIMAIWWVLMLLLPGYFERFLGRKKTAS